MARNPKITVDRSRDDRGWTRNGDEWHHCATVLQHVLNGRPPCEEPAVWRVQENDRGLIVTGHYCDGHLPADASAILKGGSQ